jgi:heme/copper-type cytochrome/quinol oxidase subunit 2
MSFLLALLVHVTAERYKYMIHCSIFCGSGHEEMSGEIVVKE